MCHLLRCIENFSLSSVEKHVILPIHAIQNSKFAYEVKAKTFPNETSLFCNLVSEVKVNHAYTK